MLSAVDGRPSGRSGRRAAWTTGRPCILSVCYERCERLEVPMQLCGVKCN